MPPSIESRLENPSLLDIRRTLEAQNRAWERLEAEFSALPPVEFAIQSDCLEEIERALYVPTRSVAPNAVRV